MGTNLSLSQKVNTQATKSNIPLSTFIEVTHKCNLYCYYCYQTEKVKQPALTLGQWQNILSQLADLGGLYITFSGGEPFIYDDFISLVTCAKKYNFAISIITNGTLLSRSVIEQLQDLSILDIGISFHAGSFNLHDQLTGIPGSFHQALKAVRECISAGLKVIIKHSVSQKNFGEYITLMKLAENEGCLFECDSLILPSCIGSVSDFKLSQDQIYAVNRDLNLFQEIKECESSQLNNLRCDAGRSICGISPQGVVYPCILLPIAFGKLGESTFNDIWHGIYSKAFRDQEIVVNNICNTCNNSKFCSFCYAVAYWEKNSWRIPSESLCNRALAIRKGLSLLGTND